MGTKLKNVTPRLVALPRIMRMLIAMFITAMVTLALSPLVDHIYLRFFFTADTVMLPALVTVAIATATYVWGWLFFIGTVNTVPSSQRPIQLYIGVGIIATIIVIVLLVQGLSMA